MLVAERRERVSLLSPTLSIQTSLSGLILGDLVQCVLPAIFVLTVSSLCLWNVHLQTEISFLTLVTFSTSVLTAITAAQYGAYHIV